MNGTLTLKNPVMINGDKITEMKYDTNEIDGVLFATAEAKRKAAAGMKNLSVSATAESTSASTSTSAMLRSWP